MQFCKVDCLGWSSCALRHLWFFLSMIVYSNSSYWLPAFYYLFKPNLSSYLRYYAEASNQFAEPIYESLLRGNTSPFEEMLQWWRAVGNILLDLTDPRFEPQTPAPERNMLPLDQLAVLIYVFICFL